MNFVDLLNEAVSVKERLESHSLSIDKLKKGVIYNNKYYYIPTTSDHLTAILRNSFELKDENTKELSDKMRKYVKDNYDSSINIDDKKYDEEIKEWLYHGSNKDGKDNQDYIEGNFLFGKLSWLGNSKEAHLVFSTGRFIKGNKEIIMKIKDIYNKNKVDLVLMNNAG